MSMNDPCVIGFPRWTTEASFAGGSYASGYGIANASTLPLSLVARTTDLQASSTQFVATLSRVRPIRVLGMVRHNVSENGEMRVIISNASGRVSGSEIDGELTYTLPDGMALARAGTGSFIDADGYLKWLSSDLPRFDHNGATGRPLGLLVEPERTNLYGNSQNFERMTDGYDYSWQPAGSVTTSATLAPDGTMTAARFTASAAGGYYLLQRVVDFTFDTVYCGSIWVKYYNAGGRYIAMRPPGNPGTVNNYNGAAVFDTLAGEWIYEQPDASVPVKLGVEFGRDGWFRPWISGKADAAAPDDSSVILLFVNSSAIEDINNGNWSPTGTEAVYVWGAQAEVGETPTSYIHTPASARVTRAADVLTATVMPSEYAVALQLSEASSVITTVAVASTTLSIDLPTRNNHVMYASVQPTRIVLNSGWFSVWQEVFGSDDLVWEDDRFWTGRYAESERADYVWTRPILFSTAVEGLELKVELRDPENAAGYVEFGLFEIASAWQSSIQFDWGAQFGFEDRVDVVQAQNGKYFNRLDEPRVFTGAFPMIDRDEALAFPMEMRRQLKTDVPFMWIPHPDETIHWLRTAYLARFIQPQLHAYAIPEFDGVPISLEEVIE